MRFSTDQIKQAILHPEEEVRVIALMYFADSFSDDPTVMPLVIQAVERYGKQTSFELLRQAEWLCQTPATVDWLIGQLRCEFDTKDIDQDNLRYALALILCYAEPELLAPRHSDIMSLPGFPESLKESLGECLKLEFSDWPTLWGIFEEFGKQTMVNGTLSRADHHHFDRLLRALARHRDADAKRVLSLLQQVDRDQELMTWLEPWIVQLAGRLRLADAIPLILGRIEMDDDAVWDAISNALIRIGGDAVVDALIEKWPLAFTESRYILADVLRNIHTDAAHEHLLDCLKKRDDFDLEIFIASSALGHFSHQAVEAVRQLLLEYDEQEMSADHWDLRYDLVAVATLMDELFPEYEAWHKEAVETNYGWTKLKDNKPKRLADAFTDEENGSRPSRRIEGQTSTVYQLKITIKEIKPPVWRRLLVPDCTLDDLHEIIQAVMGWENSHLYAFRIDGREFTRPDMDEGELNMEDATATSLSEVISKEKQKFVYQYDFGDDWRHEVVVEKIGTPEPDQKYPQCIKGSRACPPEDVGGPWGYVEYLEALADPDHESHEELLDWRGEFAPEAFDLVAVNRELQRVFW